MAAKLLSRAQALSSGHELWVSAQGANAHPLKNKIEWYLNFQLLRADQHIATPLSAQVRSIISEQNMPFPLTNQQNMGALLIPAENNLPTRFYVEVPHQADADPAWVKQIYKIWQSMNSPTLRIFLPATVSAETLQKLWPEPMADEISVVPGA